MDKTGVIRNLAKQWTKIAERDLITAKQGLETKQIITDTVCFHCQQAAEKYLKAYLVYLEQDFP